MTEQTVTLTPRQNNLDAIPDFIVPKMPIVGRARRATRAIVDWFFASPSPQAYVRTDTSLESASSRAARIRRNQEAVDELFAAPGPEEACLARFWGAGC